MPYRIHYADKHEKVVALADFLTTVPHEEFSELLDEAKILLRDREFGNENLGRNCKSEEPYWFENRLIADAHKHIAAGNPLKAYMECLRGSNHRHSGFTSQSYRVYMRPVNDVEREMSEKIRQMILKVADALISSDPLSNESEMGVLGYGWGAISDAYECLVMLGQDVPLDMICRLRSLVLDCKKFTRMNSEIDLLQHAFKCRFG
jgi:hypothetical protein